MRTKLALLLVFILVFSITGYSQNLTRNKHKSILNCCKGLYPVGLMYVYLTPVFRWSGVEGATSYRLQVYVNQTLLIDVFTEDTKYLVQPNEVLPPLSAISWHIRAYKEQEERPVCQVFSFITGFWNNFEKHCFDPLVLICIFEVLFE